VVRELYDAHKGNFHVTTAVLGQGDASALTQEQEATVDTVLEFYGDRSAQWLSDLTHMEKPWREARGGAPDGVSTDDEITLESMAEYYSSL